MTETRRGSEIETGVTDMNIGAGVFVLNEASTLVPMQPACFASEDDFQDLLARFPALLAGDQMNSANPRRFLLIDRELPMAEEPGGPGLWSLDHLFLDQDGMPTLVEVKRSTDTRIRREFVGPMFDYAANATLHWPVEALRGRFDARYAGAGRTPEEVPAEELGVKPDVDAFWGSQAPICREVGFGCCSSPTASRRSCAR
jgi:hypothetical protein